MPPVLSYISSPLEMLERTLGMRRETFAASVAAAAVGVLAFCSIAPGLLVPARYQLLGIPAWRDVTSRLSSGSTNNSAKIAGSRKRLDAWIESERVYAWHRLLKNIHPEGTDPGCVVASPSKKDPDYFYQWTRDSAMVFKVVIEYWKRDLDPTGTAEQLIKDFIHETKKLQHMDTPSGGYRTGGLGEVKFHGDGRPYRGNWGRPQGDGPALRSTALIGFAETLLDKDTAKWEPFIRRELYDSLEAGKTESIIKADLDYVTEYWHKQCFDLWEEVHGIHHFNMLVSIRSLLDGARLATRLGDTGSAEYYRKVANDIHAFLPKFWDDEQKSLLATIEWTNNCGKVEFQDTGTVLGFNHAGDLANIFDHSATAEKPEQHLGSDISLASQYTVAESMRREYPLNAKHYPARKGYTGFGIGRYYEDVYDGDGKRKTGEGNPWYLTTMAHAEFLYRLIPIFSRKAITINNINRSFWQSLNVNLDNVASSYAKSSKEKSGHTYQPGSAEHTALVRGLQLKGDAFLKVVMDWARWDGGLWEQFDRKNGGEMGAPHLTWSYAAFLSCIAAREGKPMFPFEP